MNAEKKLELIRDVMNATVQTVPIGTDATSVWFGLFLAINTILSQPD